MSVDMNFDTDMGKTMSKPTSKWSITIIPKGTILYWHRVGLILQDEKGVRYA